MSGGDRFFHALPHDWHGGISWGPPKPTAEIPYETVEDSYKRIEEEVFSTVPLKAYLALDAPCRAFFKEYAAASFRDRSALVVADDHWSALEAIYKEE